MYRKIKYVWTCTLLLTAIAGVAFAPEALCNGIRWKNYEAGMAAAKKENRKILLKFYADWCRYCKQMDRTTFSDPKVAAYIREHFVPVKINTDKRKGLTIRYRVSSLPMNFFLSPRGERIFGLPGYMPPKMFLYVLQYVAEDAYRTRSFREFMQGRR